MVTSPALQELPRPRRFSLRSVGKLLVWLLRAVSVYNLLSSETASSAIETITELAARLLIAI